MHVFGSYVTGQLPRTHPVVVDTTHDDRAVEGVCLGNNLCTPNFWMYSFKHKKVLRMSDPKHFDTILPFLQPLDVPHRIDLTVADIEAMHTVAGQDVDFLHPTSNVHTRSRGPLDDAHSSSLVSDPSSSDSGENSRDSGEIQAESLNTTAETRVSDSSLDMELTLQDHRRFKHAKDVPPEAVIQCLKPSMLGQILVHHKHVLTLPSSFLNEPNDTFGEIKMMTSKAYSIKQFWYVDIEVVIPDAKHLQYQGRVWQVPIILVAGMSASIPPNEAKRKQFEAQVSDLRATERVAEAITLLQEREKNFCKKRN